MHRRCSNPCRRRSHLTIKKGDVVRVIAGRDKGAEGKVIAVEAEKNRVIVEGVNRVKRHTKLVNQGGRTGTTGGIITQEASIHASNVMLLAEVDGKKVPTRVGAKRVEVNEVPQRRLDVQRAPQRAHRHEERRGDLMTTETTETTEVAEKAAPAARESRGSRLATARRSCRRSRKSSASTTSCRCPV